MQLTSSGGSWRALVSWRGESRVSSRRETTSERAGAWSKQHLTRLPRLDPDHSYDSASTQRTTTSLHTRPRLRSDPRHRQPPLSTSSPHLSPPLSRSTLVKAQHTHARHASQTHRRRAPRSVAPALKTLVQGDQLGPLSPPLLTLPILVDRPADPPDDPRRPSRSSTRNPSSAPTFSGRSLTTSLPTARSASRPRSTRTRTPSTSTLTSSTSRPSSRAQRRPRTSARNSSRTRSSPSTTASCASLSTSAASIPPSPVRPLFPVP